MPINNLLRFSVRFYNNYPCGFYSAHVHNLAPWSTYFSYFQFNTIGLLVLRLPNDFYLRLAVILCVYTKLWIHRKQVDLLHSFSFGSWNMLIDLLITWLLIHYSFISVWENIIEIDVCIKKDRFGLWLFVPIFSTVAPVWLLNHTMEGACMQLLEKCMDTVSRNFQKSLVLCECISKKNFFNFEDLDPRMP